MGDEIFKEYLDRAEDLIFAVDADRRLVYANPAAAKFARRMSGMAAGALAPNRIESFLLDVAGPLIGDGEKASCYERSFSESGRTITFEIKATSLHEGDMPSETIYIARDVSKRKKREDEFRETETALKASREMFRTFAEGIMHSIFVIQNVDGEYRYTYVNPAFTRYTGYSLEELKSKTIFDVIAPDFHEITRQRARNKLRGGEAEREYEMKVITKDGQERWVAYCGFPIEFDGRPAILGSSHNLTEIKLALAEQRLVENALRESEEKYRLVVENAREAIIVTQEGRIVFVNRTATEITGYPKDVLTSQTFTDFIHPEDREMVMRNHILRMGGEEVPPIYTFRVMSSRGSVIWLEINSVLIQWNKRPANLSFLNDVTVRKRVEQESRHLETQLMQAQKMESIGTLAGGIAHDFNNLLMGIQGYTSLMLLDVDRYHPHYDRLKSIEAQVQSGAELSRQLLGFARGGRYEIRPTDMNEVLEKTSSMFGRTKKEIRIHRKYDESLWTAEVDEGQIEQALLNLYVNAWQAMPGGGEMYLETLNVTIDENFTRVFSIVPGKYIKLSVTDTGIGMDERTKGRIFEPFFTTKGMGRGTGLGLAMVYGIIKGHNGIIDVDSDIGKGTTFNVYLPASGKTVARNRKYSPKPIQGNETILVIDDEEMILDVTKELLENLGYRVITAKSGEEAVEIYRSKTGRIDLLLLDMVMPGMGGREAFARLKAFDPGVKVILSSGYSLGGQAAGILAEGCRAFIQKPYKIGDLSEKIRSVLNS